MTHINIIDLFQQVASENPDKSAIIENSQNHSYKQIDESTDKLAAYLQHYGKDRSDLCFVFVSSSTAVAKSLIGTFKAGKLFVPISTDYPNQKIVNLIKAYAPNWFILDNTTAGRFKKLSNDIDHDYKCCSYDLSPEVDACFDCANFISSNSEIPDSYTKIPLGEDDPCYIYFTSGSTGKPKPILGAYRGINHFINWEINYLELEHSTNVSQFTAPGFDAFLRDLFVPLCSAGTLYVPPKKDGILAIENIGDWLQDNKINLIHCVPSLLREMINGTEFKTELGDLKFVLLSGEALLAKDIKDFNNSFKHEANFINLYGSSETTMVKFAYKVNTEKDTAGVIPIGKPIKGAKAIVLDESLMPVNDGIVGEIYIMTQYRSLGYYKDRELTDQVFVKHLMSKSSENKLYRTGDLGVIRNDGVFEFKGRCDDQIKFRGERVQLGEIESCLRSNPAVQDALVMYDQEHTALGAWVR